MSEYEASNGVVILRLPRGIGFRRPNEITSTWGINEEKVDALQEFFQHARDEELGRWRYPSDPSLVVYPRDGKSVMVFDERVGVGFAFFRADVRETAVGKRACAAKAYFDAHPEPKPWHDAKPGEVWILGVGGGYHCDSASVVQTGAGVRFFWGVKGGGIRDIATNDPSIDYAHRIWPEEVA